MFGERVAVLQRGGCIADSSKTREDLYQAKVRSGLQIGGLWIGACDLAISRLRTPIKPRASSSDSGLDTS
eukprot:15450153-Alexandrium_andersonii.AAC.1